MDDAHRYFTQSLEHNPSPEAVGPAYVYLGHIAARREDWGEAARCWREAVVRLPRDGLVWYNLGDALLGTGEYREAIRALRRSLRLGTEEPAWACYDLARGYQRLGDIRRARTACEQALRYKPQDQDTLGLKSELQAS
jgi:tetratricopeptide (TPR) repeat protein